MTEKRTIEQHISEDHQILEDPNISPQRRRHIEDELSHLERYAKEHEKDIEAGDHHDPTDFEMFCDEEPWAVECKLYED